MTTGYQIYMKRKNESCFHEAGLNNWFWKEEDAIERCAKLTDSWKHINGNEYIVVKLG